jgi:hypothetical protein
LVVPGAPPHALELEFVGDQPGAPGELPDIVGGATPGKCGGKVKS